MSSEVDGLGIIAVPVILPAAVALGAGWLAWQGGKLLVEANRAADRQIAEKKRQLAEAERHRKMCAVAAHNQLADMCSQILSQLENSSVLTSITGLSEIEQLKYELKKICEENLPDDTAQIEALTSVGYLKLDKIVRQQNQLASMTLTDSESGLYRGLSLVDLMDDLRIAIAAMDIQATNGADVRAADPAVLERAKLNDAFVAVTNRIMTALENIEILTHTYGLNKSGSEWFHSCFNGIDAIIENLCKPTTSNKELKKGIQKLEKCMEQYEIMAPSIENELKKMLALYEVYIKVSDALFEETEDIKAFKTSADIEKRLRYLQSRVDKAQECAKIYQKLGSAAYLCYAWDCELKAMGYEVHTRKKITEMASQKPQYAKLGETKIPFYQWNEDFMTQLYSITSECALQVIVHKDGAVSMQTIADANNSEIVEAQHSHCAQLKTLHERLRKNWFIAYNFDENKPADSVTTVSGWKASSDFGWKETSNEFIEGRKSNEKTAEKAKQIK